METQTNKVIANISEDSFVWWSDAADWTWRTCGDDPTNSNFKTNNKLYCSCRFEMEKSWKYTQMCKLTIRRSIYKNTINWRFKWQNRCGTITYRTICKFVCLCKASLFKQLIFKIFCSKKSPRWSTTISQRFQNPATIFSTN